MAPVTENAALIVAHGSPSDPGGPERVLRALGGAVQALLGPGWVVRGATLAAPGAVDAALGDLPGGARLMVYPHFMADGWFSTEELPRRLRSGGVESFDILPAFGLDPAVHRLCLGMARAALTAAGHGRGEAALLVAAHGSPSDHRPAASARTAARFLEASGAFRAVVTGFIDEAPYIGDAAGLAAPAICLPFFAGRAGHVQADLPRALAEAAFPGPMLDPVGAAPQVPGIIAAALTRAAAKRAA